MTPFIISSHAIILSHLNKEKKKQSDVFVISQFQGHVDSCEITLSM
jgi:hypothetical protein